MVRALILTINMYPWQPQKQTTLKFAENVLEEKRFSKMHVSVLPNTRKKTKVGCPQREAAC